MRTSRIQQKRRRQSRRQQSRRRQQPRRQQLRRGGRPSGSNLFQISYEVLCNKNYNQPKISASDLFLMVNCGLYDMASGRGDPAILGVENVVISQLFNREREAYSVCLDVSFPDEMDPSDLNAWKASYLAGIQGEELFTNGSFEPIENTFFFEPMSEPEYPEWQPPREVRDV